MTVTRPASAPTWATDANFTNGGVGIAGTPTKVAPSGPVQAEGNVPGTPLPAQRLNWFQNLVGGWTAWLSAIIDSSEEHTYQTPKARTNIRIVPRMVVPGSWAAQDPVSTHVGFATAVHSDVAYYALDLFRSGQTFTGISVYGAMGHTEATSGNRFHFELWKIRNDGLTVGDAQQLGATTYFASSTATQSNFISGLTEVIDNTTWTYYLKVISSTTAGDGGLKDKFFYCKLSYTDLGPRNPQ